MTDVDTQQQEAQPENGTLWSSFRVILELENRGQQIDAAIANLKAAFSDPESLSIPEAVGIASELRWHLDHSLKQLSQLEEGVGVKRRETKDEADAQPKTKRRPTGYSLQGSTRSISLSDLVGLLSNQKKTGSLWIKGREEKFILELVDGAIVHAICDSRHPDHRLGTVLVARDKLSTEKLEEFLEQYCPEDGKIGELLTKAQLVSEDDLRDALEWQVRELFRRIASLDEAAFCFREGAVSKLEMRVCLNGTELLLDKAEANVELPPEPTAEADADSEADSDVEADADSEAESDSEADTASAETADDILLAGDPEDSDEDDDTPSS